MLTALRKGWILFGLGYNLEFLMKAERYSLFFAFFVGFFESDGQASKAEFQLLAPGQLTGHIDHQVKLGSYDDP